MVRLVIFLTGKCNLNCDYCFVKKEDLSKYNLNFKDVRRALNHFLCVQGDKKIEFLGGEPLLKYDLIKKIINYVRLKDKNAGFVLVTNGLNLTSEKIDFLLKNNCEINVSFDGTKDIQNTQRGSGLVNVYDIILDNIPFELRDKINTNSVVTIDTAPTFSRNLQHLVDLGFQRIKINIDENHKWTNSELLILEKEFNNAAQDILGRARKGDTLYFFQPIYLVTHLVFLPKEKLTSYKNIKELIRFKCGRCYVLDTDASFYPCERLFIITRAERKEFCCGKGAQGIDFKKKASLLDYSFKSLEKNINKKCLTCNLRRPCPYITVCGEILGESELKRRKEYACTLTHIFNRIFLKLITILLAERNDNFMRVYDIKTKIKKHQYLCIENKYEFLKSGRYTRKINSLSNFYKQKIKFVFDKDKKQIIFDNLVLLEGIEEIHDTTPILKYLELVTENKELL